MLFRIFFPLLFPSSILHPAILPCRHPLRYDVVLDFFLPLRAAPCFPNFESLGAVHCAILCAFFALFMVLVLFVSIRCVVCMLNFIAIQQMCANVFCVLFSHAFAEMISTCRIHAQHKTPVRNTHTDRNGASLFLFSFIFHYTFCSFRV